MSTNGNLEAPTAEARGAAGRSASAQTRVTLLTEEDGKTSFWSVDVARDDVSAVDEPVEGLVISFSDQDHQARALPRESDRSLRARFLAEHGETMRVLNLARTTGMVFATPVDRVTAAPYRIAPGAQLLLELVRRGGRARRPLITGLLLGQGGPTALLIVAHLSANDELQALGFAPKAGDPNYYLQNYAKSHNLQLEDDSLQLFDLSDFAAALPLARSYPREPQFLGLAQRHYLAAGRAALAGGACAAIGWAGLQQWRLHDAERAGAHAQARLAAARADIARMAAERFDAFTALGNVPAAAAIDLARIVHVPGARVVLNASRDAVRLTTVAPLAGGTDAGRAGLARPPPAGCERTEVATNNAANELQLRYACPGPAGPLAALFAARP